MTNFNFTGKMTNFNFTGKMTTKKTRFIDGAKKFASSKNLPIVYSV